MGHRDCYLFCNGVPVYRYGPAHKQRWKFLSPGSILATGLAVLTSLGLHFTSTISRPTTKLWLHRHAYRCDDMALFKLADHPDRL